MKNILIAAAVVVSSIATAAPQQEFAKYRCSMWQNENGNNPIGVISPVIVGFAHDSSGGRDMYVKTGALAPRAKPSYERLIKKVQHIEGAIYESKTFEVHTFYRAGIRANIVNKQSKMTATCSGTVTPR